MTRHKAVGRIAAVALLAVFALVANACGDDDTATTTTAATTTSAGDTTTTAGDTTTTTEAFVLGEHQVAFGTGPAGGSSFNIGAAMAETIRANAPNLDITAEEVTIAPSNMTRLANGELDLGFNTTYDVYRAINGIADFEGNAVDGINFVVGGTLGGFGFVVPQSTGITTLQELCGTQFAIGSQTAKDILSSILVIEGIDPECINWNMGISYDQIVVGFQDGTIQAAGFVGIPLASATKQLDETVPVTYLSLSKDKIAEHDAEFPFFPAQIIPNGSLTQQTEDWVVAGFVQGIWTHESVPEDLVYQFVMGLLQNSDACVALQAGCGAYSLETSLEWIEQNLTLVPVHPGAQRALDELSGNG